MGFFKSIWSYSTVVVNMCSPVLVYMKAEHFCSVLWSTVIVSGSRQVGVLPLLAYNIKKMEWVEEGRRKCLCNGLGNWQLFPVWPTCCDLRKGENSPDDSPVAPSLGRLEWRLGGWLPGRRKLQNGSIVSSPNLVDNEMHHHILRAVVSWQSLAVLGITLWTAPSFPNHVIAARRGRIVLSPLESSRQPPNSRARGQRAIASRLPPGNLFLVTLPFFSSGSPAGNSTAWLGESKANICGLLQRKENWKYWLSLILTDIPTWWSWGGCGC